MMVNEKKKLNWELAAKQFLGWEFIAVFAMSLIVAGMLIAIALYM